MKFEIATPMTHKLDKCNSRMEHHGESLVLAIDLAVTLTTHNSILDLIHPKLRQSLYFNAPAEAAAEAGQTELDLPVSDLPNIIFAKLAYPVKWDHEWTGYTVHVDFGIGGASDITIKLCKVHNLKITPLEGGSCEVKYTISSAADINEQIVGKLSMLQQREITLTALAPHDVEGGLIDGTGAQQLEGGADKADPAKPGKANKKGTATDAFIAEHGAAH